MNTLNAIFTRLLYIAEAIALIYFSVCITSTYYLIILIGILFIIIIDGIYVIWRRKSIETRWVSISTMSFLSIFIITIWIIVFYKLNLNDSQCYFKNITNIESRSLCHSINYTVCQLQHILVEVVLISVMFARWSTTVLQLNKWTHLEVFMILLAGSCDCLDFYNYIGESKISNNTTVVATILSLFTLSLTQFFIVLTTVKVDTKAVKRQSDSPIRNALNNIWSTSIWSVMIICFTQDLPYFIMRIILLSVYGLTSNTTIYFYLIKNFILLYYHIYRIYFMIKELKVKPKLRRINASSITDNTNANHVNHVSNVANVHNTNNHAIVNKNRPSKESTVYFERQYKF